MLLLEWKVLGKGQKLVAAGFLLEMEKLQEEEGQSLPYTPSPTNGGRKSWLQGVNRNEAAAAEEE